MFLKQSIKNLLATLSLLKKKKGASVLMYHSVAENSVFFTVHPKIFAKQMKYLKENNYQVISLTDLITLLKNDQPLPNKTVALTFDDGFKDFFLNAWPVLAEYNFPATIF